MSGIYKALNRSNDSAVCAVLDAIEAELEDNGAVVPGTNAEQTTVIAGAGNKSGGHCANSGGSATGSARAADAQASTPADSGATTELALYKVAFRTVPLRLSAKTPVLPFDGADPNTAEEYRLLRTRILQHPAVPRMVVISSASAGDGKTVTAVNLAGTLAMKTDARVLLIDADMRRSSVARMLGIPSEPGLSEVLRGECSLDDAIVCTTELPNLHVLPAGVTPRNPAELLDSALWQSIADNLRNRFAYIVVDSTPMDAVADFELVQAVCDGILVVIRPDHTNRKLFDAALKRRPAERVLGVVINGIEAWPFSKAETSYYGAYRQG
ncbi:MAG: CpsD/CapB family tyrosine-protein kinase [Acidobacteriaceae bacterium]|nr:CpsD/CapB family tyrosine-protein kinase [Acidobacteriaceae bacterium]